MNKYNKKKFPILIKVFVVHLFIILIIDINISAVVNKDLKSLNEINKAQFLNLKSISLEELEKKRKVVEEKKIIQGWGLKGAATTILAMFGIANF